MDDTRLSMRGGLQRTAYDGLAALDLAASFSPEVIFLDLGMPVLDGYATAARMREQPWGETVVLIALTGWGQDEHRRRAREAGFDHHLVKPVDGESVLALLAGL